MSQSSMAAFAAASAWIFIAAASCATGVQGEEDDGSTAFGEGGMGGPLGSSSSAIGGDPAGPGSGGASTAAMGGAGGMASSSAVTSAASSSSAASSAVSSSSSSSGSGGSTNCPPPPTNLMGCSSCANFCDSPWPVSWSPVTGATHYIVQYSCLLNMPMYQTASTSADLCTQVGMCNDSSCAFGAGPVTVKACNSTCCSNAVQFPTLETPTACGGGVCC